MRSRYDVVVVGYGPVGAVAATLLAQGGLSVLLVDREADIFDKPRAIGMDHESMRILQFCGIANELFPHVRPYRGSIWTGVDGQIIREFGATPEPYPLAWPPNFTFLQPQFERLLRDRVEHEPGVEVGLCTEAVSIEQVASTVRVRLEDLATRRSSEVEGRYVIGCDGANSIVRRSLNIELEDLGLDEWWAVADTLRNGEADFGDRNVQYCSPERPSTYVVGPGALRRWEFRILPDESPESFDSEKILEILSRRIDISLVTLWRIARYRFQAVVARQWRIGRIFLAGDAAHQTPPHLGQGLVSGMRDAANLSWKLLQVEAGAGEALLDTYMVERRPHFRSLVQTAKDYGAQIGILDVDKARERDVELGDLYMKRSGPELRQSYIPSLSGGFLDLDDQGAPRGMAGKLFVQPWIAAPGCRRLFEDERRMNFLLVTLGIDAQAWLDSECAKRWQDLDADRIAILAENAVADGADAPASVTTVRETGTVFRNWMNEAGCQAVIVRPDRYVFGAARTPAELNSLVIDLTNRLSAG